MNFRLLAERVPGTWQLFAGLPSGDQVVSWSVAALAAGFDAPSLRMLASFSSPTSWFEIEKDFRNSLQELGLVPYPTEDDARRFHGDEIARQLLSGGIDVESALREFHDTVVSPLHHPTDLKAWCQLSCDLHPRRLVQITMGKRNILAFQAARALLDERQDSSA